MRHLVLREVESVFGFERCIQGCFVLFRFIAGSDLCGFISEQGGVFFALISHQKLTRWNLLVECLA